MKLFVVALLGLASFAFAEYVQEIPGNTAYGYLKNIGVPEAERIRKAEEVYLSQRIVGGLPAVSHQYPYQAGLISDIIGINGNGVCGGSLISNQRVLTAAHCWFDGINQAWRLTVVLGSHLLFSGGVRIHTSAVAMHGNWLPQLVRNDIAVIYLGQTVSFSNTISPIALPSGSQLDSDFAGVSAVATGFGLTSDGGSISVTQSLSQVRVNVITNSVCSFAFPLLLQSSNICTSGIGGIGVCNGDSGGPLVTNSNGQNILIGVTSFGSLLGCESALPAAFARVTSYIDFIKSHL